MFEDMNALNAALEPLRDPEHPLTKLLKAANVEPKGGTTELRIDSNGNLQAMCTPVNALRDRVSVAVGLGEGGGIDARVLGRHNSSEPGTKDLAYCMRRIADDLNLLAEAV